MQQMWCADDASQSMQSLWFLQQERNRFSGSLIQAIRKQIRMGLLFCMGNRRQFLPQRSRACLKNHFRNLQAPLCGIFYPHSVAVARYAALIRIKSPTNWDSQLTKSLFQTRSRACLKNKNCTKRMFHFPFS